MDRNDEAIEQTAKSAGCLPADEKLVRLSDFFKVMSDPTRLKLLMALENQELCVSDLADTVEMSSSAVSHQLRALKSAKLVKSRRDGKAIFYSLDDEHIHSVIRVAFEHILEEE